MSNETAELEFARLRDENESLHKRIKAFILAGDGLQWELSHAAVSDAQQRDDAMDRWRYARGVEPGFDGVEGW